MKITGVNYVGAASVFARVDQGIVQDVAYCGVLLDGGRLYVCFLTVAPL